MRFDSELKRSHHPLVYLIPSDVWHKDFYGEIKDYQIRLMLAVPEFENLEQLIPDNLTPQDQYTTWFAIAYGHRAMKADELFGFFTKLDIARDKQLLLTLVFGNKALLQHFFDDYKNESHIIQDMIEANDYALVFEAAQYGHGELFNQLAMLLESNKKQAMLDACAYRVFSIACWFIPHEIKKLQNNQLTFQQDNPEEEFDLKTKEEAELYLCMVRHMIQKNPETIEEDMDFLISIQSIGALVTAKSNELLKLAVRHKNDVAKDILLQIPEVRALQVQERTHIFSGFFNRNALAKTHPEERKASSLHT
ncbi:MAG: hypothetical protein QNK11_07805 [Legionella sp.]|nr:hypothetical protein [Legionella sp.]